MSFDGLKVYIAASYLKVEGESMSRIRFWTAGKGDLPQLSYIFRNADPLGAEFNTVSCYVKVALLFIELYRGKKVRNHRK